MIERPKKTTADSTVLGLDIGGANLKAADTQGWCAAQPFAMWLDWRVLAQHLQRLVNSWTHRGQATHVALTMTGELADCFADRQAGVRHILSRVEQAFPGLDIHVYGVEGEWLSPGDSSHRPWQVAASNWHALATWLAQTPPTPGPVDLVVDIGSTTVDVIPVRDGALVTTARTDRDRLIAQQLVYTGTERTSIAATVSHFRVDDEICPVMAEHFADTGDAYLLLGLAAEQPDDVDTADHRPRTTAMAHARMARMIGEDATTLDLKQCVQMARQVLDAQARRVWEAIRQNSAHVEHWSESKSSREGAAVCPRLLFSGHGRGLAQHVLELARQTLAVDGQPTAFYLEDYLSEAASRCAPAVAVANLLVGQISDKENCNGSGATSEGTLRR